ncbi:MAG: hypothetical protein LUC85_09525 [Bacteroidales bacterium]|nr:hypothetical protein [Bacteroidales bacterium]MCD8395053.1 hypothetical protein [Bacteroidales bacterium]
MENRNYLLFEMKVNSVSLSYRYSRRLQKLIEGEGSPTIPVMAFWNEDLRAIIPKRDVEIEADLMVMSMTPDGDPGFYLLTSYFVP